MSRMSFRENPSYSLADFDRLFDEAFSARTSGTNATQRLLRPRMDVHEDKDKNLVTTTFDLPWLSKENVQIDIRDDVLTVSGESTISSEHNEQGYAVRERRFGKFSRSLPVPQGIKPEDIKASMENGVLTVAFLRTTPEQAPQKITIS
ncbi:HSP20-like chaperone [Fomes fomentarius]|nr:HSP20-like chaperone [Fomes fomentarius]